MDRKIVYAGQIPLETDLLGTNQNTMVALGKLAAAIFGTSGMVSGLAVSPNTPAALNVVVSPGEIYQLQNLEATAYSSLPVDQTHTCVKQGILLDAVTLPCAAPTTAGFSINYLIEAAYVDADINSIALPYYNASNPTQAFSGPNNTGAQQATTRAGQVQLQVKAGVAAATGTQVTPAADAGNIALAVVTVANGQATIAAGNIVQANAQQILGAPVTRGRLIGVQVFSIAGTYPYKATPGTRYVESEVGGGGGAGGSTQGATSTSASAAPGGSSGGYTRGIITSGFDGVTVTVGAGGAKNAPGAVGGGAGGTSSFGSLLSATGGGGGSAGFTIAPPFASPTTNAGGAGSGGSLVNSRGSAGKPGYGFQLANAIGGYGGDSVFGAGAIAPGAAAAGVSNAGVDASSPSSGGSGAVAASSGAAQSGGNGAPGIVIVREYA